MTENQKPPKPSCGEFQTVYWNEGVDSWWVRDLTPDEIVEKFSQPAAPEISAEQLVRYQRADAFREEADPLFFKWQRGECEKSEWLEKVEAIRAQHPYPD
jgi:hypothetical protein